MRAVVVALLLALISASTASAQAPGGAEDNLKQKNIALPPPATPVANYIPAIRVGNLLFFSGSGPGQTDQPGIFVPPTMLVLSSQAGWFREEVAGPRDCCADGPCCT
jgi:hypothetical protein